MDTGLLSLKWNNHGTTFFHVLSSLRDKGSYSDVTLACEGKFYPVHKLVLSTCSEYFEDIFNHTQCRQPVIVLKDIRHKELEALLNYMYLGEVNVIQADLAGLIKAAECLKVKGLAVPDEAPSPPRNISSSSSRETKRSASSREGPQQNKRLRAEDDSSRNASSSSVPNENIANSSQPCQDPSSRDQREAQQRSTESNSRLAVERLDDALPSSSPSPVEIVSDEPVVKTELLDEPKDENASSNLQIDADNGLAFDPLTSGMQGEGGQGGFDHEVLSSHPQNIEDLVAQAMPGTSGMQGDSQTGWGGSQGGGGADLSRFPLDAFHMENAEGGTQGSGGSQQQQQQSMGGSIYDTAKPQAWSFRRQLKPPPAAVESSLVTRTAVGASTVGYNCALCNKYFRHSKDMRRHIRTHTGEKPFACTMCDFRAAVKSSVKRHMMFRHPEAFEARSLPTWP